MLPCVQTPLIASLLAYIGRLFGYSVVYTLNSIKKFHQVYHNMRIYTVVTDPSSWIQWEQALVDRHLRDKDQVTASRRPTKEALGPNVGNASYASLTSGPRAGGTPTLYQGRQACILWNQGRQCPQYCHYQHVCINCKRNHPAGSCSTRPTTLSQTAWSDIPPNPAYMAPTWPSTRSQANAQPVPWQNSAVDLSANQARLGWAWRWWLAIPQAPLSVADGFPFPLVDYPKVLVNKLHSQQQTNWT